MPRFISKNRMQMIIATHVTCDTPQPPLNQEMQCHLQGCGLFLCSVA